MHGVNSRPVNCYEAAVLSLGIGNPAEKPTRVKMAPGFMLQLLQYALATMLPVGFDLATLMTRKRSGSLGLELSMDVEYVTMVVS